MLKRRLMTPGPTPVHPAVSVAMASPHPHHRTAEFKTVVGRLRRNLQEVFRTEAETLVLTASGTGAMEAALVSLTRPGETVICVDSGKFGHRWVDLCRAFGREPRIVVSATGQAPSVSEVRAAAAATPAATALCFAACETSTGVRADTRALAAAAREAAGDSLVIVVDAITEVGAGRLEADAWDLDVVIAGSQKAFMMPPGMAFLSLSARAVARLGATGGGGLYFDLARELKAQRADSTAWTPSTALAHALDVALERMLETGMPAIWEQTERRARMVRVACEAMGLTLYAQAPAVSLTAVRAPGELDSGRIVSRLEADFGIRIAGGQGDLKGRIFRIAHLGYIDAVETMGSIAALGITLQRLGFAADTPAALAAAASVMAEE